MLSNAHRVALRTSLIYAGAGAAWILGADRVLAALLAGSPNLVVIGTYKGAVFVLVTAALLYLGIRGQMRRIEAEAQARARVEAELRRDRERLQLAVAAGNIGFWDYDFATGAVYHSPEWKAQLGYADDELPNEAVEWDRRIHEADRERVLETLAAYNANPVGRYRQEYRLRHKDGSYRWILAQGSVERGADGKPVRLIGSHVDVTATKQAELALEQRAELNSRLANIAAVVPGAIYSFQRKTDGRVSLPYASAAITELFGLPSDGSVDDASPVFSGIHPDDLPRVLASVDESANALTPWRCEFRFRHPAKGEVWIEGFSLPHRLEDGTLLWNGFLMDITARKRAELQLRESEQQFRQLAENIREVFWLTDPATTRILYISPLYESVWGRSVESLYADPRQWHAALHPQDAERVIASVRQRENGGPYDEEYRIVRPDGTVRWIRARAFPVRNAAGEVYRIAGFAEDISERKQLEDHFLRAQRLDALGTLAAGIAHDLNNVLAPIMMCAPMLRMGLPQAQVDKMVGTIEASSRRGADLVRQLLLFGRGAEGGRAPVEPKALIGEVHKIAHETFPKNIRVPASSCQATWRVLADPTQVHQVLLNLCVNARDAMPEGGALTLRADNIALDTSEAALHPNARAGRYVRFRVADTGTGIEPQLRDKIFDPFFTTKPLGKGTGLGLSTVSGIVKSHGGFLRLDSEVGRGSIFDVYLPAHVEAGSATAHGTAHVPRGQGELILFVDDELSIREVMADLLIRNGYRVTTAEDGVEAERLFRLQSKDLAIIVTDLDMPRMDGARLAEAVRRTNPGMPIIVTSGLRSGRGGGVDRTVELERLGVTATLPKPYTTCEILNAVHAALAAAERN